MKVEEKLMKLFEGVRKGELGLGDDVEAINVGERYLVFNVDGFAAKHVMLEFMDLRDVGWRGLVACASDLVAKVVRPTHFSFSVYGRDFREVEELSAGIAEAARSYDLTFLGADTNKGEPAIDVFCFGFSKTLPPRTSGAKPGDRVVLPEGCWGCVEECLKGRYFEHCKRPKVRLDIVEALEPYRKHVSASTDSSDGLVVSLYKIAKESGVRIELEEPPPGPLGERGFYGGEEYLPVLIVSDKAEEIANAVGGRVVGKVVPGKPAVLYRGEELESRGWEWF